MLVAKQCVVYTAGKLVAANHLGGASCGEETPVRSKHLPGALLFQTTLPDTLHTAARGSQSRSNATPQSPPLQLTRLHGAITRAASRGDKAAIETIPHTLCQRTPSTLRHGQNPNQLQIAIATRMAGGTYHSRPKQARPCRLTPNKTERPPQPRRRKPPNPHCHQTAHQPLTHDCMRGRGSPSDLDAFRFLCSSSLGPDSGIGTGRCPPRVSFSRARSGA